MVKTKARLKHSNRVPPNGQALQFGPLTSKLDLGCGPNKKSGFCGIDEIAFPGVDFIQDLRLTWNIPDDFAEEVHCSHVLEHFERLERWHFMNELYRVMKPGAKATIITPDWCSQRAYGDMTHKWPPVSGFFWMYLSREWRKVNAPHNDAEHVQGGLNCNFSATWGPSLHPELVNRNQEYQQHAITFWKEAAQDMICTLIKA